jgi:hypothetical protein
MHGCENALVERAACLSTTTIVCLRTKAPMANPRDNARGLPLGASEETRTVAIA